MCPAADEVLHLWPVGRAVNNVRNNGAALLDRIDDLDARHLVRHRLYRNRHD